MENIAMYKDIAKKTGGDIYIGVVGPVRTGKSTFIKRFMENMVIPNIEDKYKRERAKDELPQSGSGRTIMTAEPKFIPEEGAEIRAFGETCRIKMVDCVGYMVDGALGTMENEVPRMFVTPWSEEEISLEQAAEIGTRKVITEHSTIGLVITTDGTVTDIEAENYVKAEEQVITELKAIGKAFAVVVNSENPSGKPAKKVVDRIKENFGVDAICVNCQTLKESEMQEIIKSVLYEFPVDEIKIKTPSWLNTLPENSEIKTYIYANVLELAKQCKSMKQIKNLSENISKLDNVQMCNTINMDLGTGKSTLHIEVPKERFYEIINEETGYEIKSDADIIPMLTKFAKIEKEYKRINGALEQVNNTGYGIVMPSLEELSLKEPEIVKHGSKYGVKLRAKAPSIHMIKATIETEVSPTVGSANTV